MFKKAILAGVLATTLLAGHFEKPSQAQSPGSVVRKITSVTPLSDMVGRYEKFEVVVELDGEINNPYDPNDVRLDGQFISPSGQTMLVAGFWYQDFAEELSATGDTLTPTEDWSWRVRFTPNEAGEWTYQILATTAVRGTVTSEKQHFMVAESDEHGFVRFDTRNPRYLAFDDGTPYFPIGANVSWYGAGGMADYQKWFDTMAENGGNFARVWMASWAFSIEWLDTGLGNYDRRQNRAYQLDTLFNMADERGIYIMLTLLNHGQFNTGVDPEWDANPYNAANGGPLSAPVEFATNPEAERLWHQKIRYIAARWGYSTHIMSWEWWNEVNWTPLASASILGPWTERSEAFLATVDPYQHLTTVSGPIVADDVVWDYVDIIHAHHYNMQSLVQDFNQAIPRWLNAYPDKPYIAGEFGSPNEYDVHGLLLHLGLWSAPMNGSLGTGMSWYWEDLYDDGLYYQLKGIAAYFAGEDLAAHQWQLLEAAMDDESKAAARVYGIQDAQHAHVWVVSKKYSEAQLVKLYEKNLRNRVEDPLDIQFPDITDAKVVISGLNDGDYTAEIWDTLAGEAIATETITVADGQGEIPLPTFNTDVAIKVNPVAE
ncbi:MAG: DUF5060 domain-containing protein [Chloroflexi bacterium]|nr:DUF5060 domain-containing protein [Chloroflexota bacterium]